MDVRANWDLLNRRIREENKAIIPGLFRIHMGAFEDLRKNGHRITANGQPVNVLAHSVTPDERFSLACRIGRALIDAQSGTVNGGFAEICSIRQACYFPNCITIALASILENIHPGLPGIKMSVLCNYDTVSGEDDLLEKNISVLESCFPWAGFQLNKTETVPPQPEKAPLLPLDRMSTLFRADGAQKIDTARTSFSGSMIRGEIREGDVLNVTDVHGERICPSGAVRAIFLKDRFENGKVVSERTPVLSKGQHADSLLVAVEIPKGSFDGIVLSK